ncbi:MAG TPA: patatin-like phospholipase family protein, partial [Solirubrobacteraceae bacterium]
MAIDLPDILVLGVGGVLGEAWLSGTLAGIEDSAGLDFRRVESFVGSSAGSIVCARLAAGRSPRSPGPDADTPGRPGEPAARGLASAARSAGKAVSSYAAVAAAPVGALALAAAAPGGALMRAAVLNRLPRPRGDNEGLEDRIERLDLSFDGRLRICAVDRGRGRRVVFGAPGAPSASVAEAVAASCCVPWLFKPVRIGSREYVDGGVWSPTNLDAAPAGAGTQVLCLTPTGGAAAPSAVWRAIKAAGRTAAELEAA